MRTEREEFICKLIGGMRQMPAAEPRKQLMIGDRQECRDTIEGYGRAGVTHFIFMTFQPYFVEEIQAFAEEVFPAVRSRAT